VQPLQVREQSGARSVRPRGIHSTVTAWLSLRTDSVALAPEADRAAATVVRIGGPEGVDRLLKVETIEQPHPLVEVLLRQRGAGLDRPHSVAEVWDEGWWIGGRFRGPRRGNGTEHGTRDDERAPHR
jgi:hypothetical protein